MNIEKQQNYVVGIDYGTDSVRVLIVDAFDGNEISTAVKYYKRYNENQYCDPLKNQFRQHPLDYIESLEGAIKAALLAAPRGTGDLIRGISIATTGSTPCAVDIDGTPLALTPGFGSNPNAMFILWKDHTAVKEALEINKLAKSWGGEDYTKFSGGVYSSEWFWSKILHTLRVDEEVRRSAFSWVEHCDWIPALLTGNTNPLEIKRSRTAAGHKAMWHISWGGLPWEDFLVRLDPVLSGMRERLYSKSFTGDIPAGKLSKEWAGRLGLNTNVIVGVGSFDAHFGAIGAEIEENMLVKVIGTSTCDMMISDTSDSGECLVKGICGQVDGSIIPGMLGMEAGQSAVGDVYAWFRNLLIWPMNNLLDNYSSLSEKELEKLKENILNSIIPELSKAAELLPVNETDIIALDWMNGRRTPNANQELKGAITGLNLGSDAPRLFKALVEATAFGAKKIVDRFNEEGIEIKGVIAVGGIPKKAPYIMQVNADVMNLPIKVSASEQVCALGTAMAAGTAAGFYENIPEAQKAMGSGFEMTYNPDPAKAEIYNSIYEKYSKLGEFIENDFTF
ncbi:MAG: ribulokinase [Ignavibacteriaceae bacterium]